MTRRKYTAGSFLDRPNGKVCPECNKRPGDVQFFGSCRVCAAAYLNDLEDRVAERESKERSDGE